MSGIDEVSKVIVLPSSSRTYLLSFFPSFSNLIPSSFVNSYDYDSQRTFQPLQAKGGILQRNIQVEDVIFTKGGLRIPLDFEVNFSEHDNNNSWYKIFVDQKKSYGLVLSSFNLEAKFIPTKRPSARILRDRKRYMIKITTLSTQTAVRRQALSLSQLVKLV